MYPICYWWVSGGYLQPDPTMYSRCFCWFPGPLAPSDSRDLLDDHTSRPGGILLQVGPSLIDIDGEYRGGGVVEEVEENEGEDASVE